MVARKVKESRHVRLYHWVLRTQAWKSLNGNQRALYIAIAERYAGVNNGRIPYSVREAATELQISKATACRCLQILIDRGFIKAEKLGHFDTKIRHATEWRLTEFSSDIDTKFATKEFANWKPEIGSELEGRLARLSARVRLSPRDYTPGKLEVSLS